MATEKRLIYLDDAKEALTGWDTDPTDEEIEYTLDCLPKVDAVEVVHGRWIPLATSWGDKATCSVCGRDLYVNEPGNGLLDIEDLHYCPNCGAKMDGERRTDNG